MFPSRPCCAFLLLVLEIVSYLLQNKKSNPALWSIVQSWSRSRSSGSWICTIIPNLEYYHYHSLSYVFRTSWKVISSRWAREHSLSLLLSHSDRTDATSATSYSRLWCPHLSSVLGSELLKKIVISIPQSWTWKNHLLWI